MAPEQQTSSEQPPQRVDIVDIDIPIGSLIVFLFKLALASIPVILVFGLFWWFFFRALD